MQRLTLILSDLYLPEEPAQAGPSRPLDLPNFEWLLNHSAPARHIRDWRHWLAAQLGETTYARIPEAQACEMEFLARGRGSAWLASPVRLEARLDHVRLHDRGMLRLDAGERAACCAEFAAVFGPQYALHDIGERAFLLTGIGPTSAVSRDPARLLGADIAAALPRGGDHAQLRRLGSEIEMWLHDAALNESRERAHQPRVSALWLWGGGSEQAVEEPGGADIRGTRGAVYFLGGDPFLVAMAQAFENINQRAVRIAPAPQSFSALDSEAEHAFVELAPMSGPLDEALDLLDEKWFAAARHALAGGALSRLEIVVNDRCFLVTRSARLRFWRRKTGWLENLARPAGKPQA
jgi:hypothetical protein